MWQTGVISISKKDDHKQRTNYKGISLFKFAIKTVSQLGGYTVGWAEKYFFV